MKTKARPSVKAIPAFKDPRVSVQLRTIALKLQRGDGLDVEQSMFAGRVLDAIWHGEDVGKLLFKPPRRARPNKIHPHGMAIEYGLALERGLKPKAAKSLVAEAWKTYPKAVERVARAYPDTVKSIVATANTEAVRKLWQSDADAERTKYLAARIEPV